MRAARIAAWMLLGPVLVGVVALSVLILYARTDGGRQRVRHLALAQARQIVPGLTLGRIDGDYLHELAIRDVNIVDGQGRNTVHVDTLSARYDLIALFRHTVAVSELRVEGAR